MCRLAAYYYSIMDVFTEIVTGYSGRSTSTVIKAVDMHTCGEVRLSTPEQSAPERKSQRINGLNCVQQPTRIVVVGYPPLHGTTLLEKREYARTHADHARLRLMREPRGHAEMYGAVLVQETELTARGEADIGVLFCHNGRYLGYLSGAR